VATAARDGNGRSRHSNYAADDDDDDEQAALMESEVLPATAAVTLKAAADA
jgi:hypothetical protein